jgi:hypothetical protein
MMSSAGTVKEDPSNHSGIYCRANSEGSISVDEIVLPSERCIAVREGDAELFGDLVEIVREVIVFVAERFHFVDHSDTVFDEK